MEITWLASYPRSGNTFVRTILFNCFGIKTASVYPKDLGGRTILEEFVGHIEHNQDKTITFQKITKFGLKSISSAVETMAEHEGLDAHKNAVSIRINCNDS